MTSTDAASLVIGAWELVRIESAQLAIDPIPSTRIVFEFRDDGRVRQGGSGNSYVLAAPDVIEFTRRWVDNLTEFGGHLTIEQSNFVFGLLEGAPMRLSINGDTMQLSREDEGAVILERVDVAAPTD